ncbi:MAG: redoxin domain-containing protein [Planctomycetia bacterium]|nr:redoxin domain-containing protein [Planctomycetia bacterium]
MDVRCRYLPFASILFAFFAAPLCLADEPAAETQAPTEAATPADQPGPAAGHSAHGEAFNDGPRQAARLMGGTGRCHFAVTTASPEAQQFFDQGVGQLHGFWYFEAERSFRQAARLDPQCAMAYWGLAMANINNEKRAKSLIKEAVERKEPASPRERQWIDSLAAYYADGDKSNKDRRRDLVRAYETIINDFPDDVEAKAFLAVLIWQNKDNGWPLSSHEAVNSLIREVLAAEPMHPVHHYRIHLWDGEKSERALTSAARCGQSSPAIAHMWHMPGHIFSGLKRYDDAAWQQEASNRVDHEYMMRDRVLPDQIHNYAHNSEWLIRDLLFVGRVHDAIRLAKNMLTSPRHPKYNLPTKGGTSASLGRERLLQSLSRFEQWEELVTLSETMYLEPIDDQADQVKSLRALGVANFSLGRNEAGGKIIDDLETRLRDEANARYKDGAEAVRKATEEKQTPEKIAEARKQAEEGHDGRINPLRNALLELWGMHDLGEERPELALALLNAAKDVPRDRLARLYLAAGKSDKAVELATADASEHERQVQPLANQVYILHAAGKAADAGEAFNKLREISAHIDLDFPPFQRLTPIARELGFAEDWRVPAAAKEDVGERPELASLGPFTWRPSPAPDWTLVAPDGRAVSLSDYRGRPVVVVFYLGYGCLHCVEQLNKFAPLTAKFREAGIELVAISTDEELDLEKSLAACTTEGGFPFPLFSDARQGVFRRYRAFDDFEDAPLHGTFLIDGNGLMRWQDISFEPFTDAEFLLQESRRLLAIPADELMSDE